MTDNDTINDFLNYLSDCKKTSANTLSAYRRDVCAFCDYLCKIKSDFFSAEKGDIASYKKMLSDSGKSVATVSRSMSSIRTLYKFLVVSGKCQNNPTAEVKNDKCEKKFFEILTEDEIDRLLSQPDTFDIKGKRDKAMLEILYATGMKVSELTSLDLSDVNLKLQTVTCRGSCTTSRGRMILLYPVAVKALEDYIKKSRSFFVADPTEQALFVNVNGERMTRQGFWKLLKGYAESANISKSITPHTLRHSFATHLLENGADINDIKNILGHADISSTQVYSDFIRSRIDNSYLRFNHRSR